MKYIDTSAFIKYYGNPETEKGVDKITKIIEGARLKQEKLITSIFMIGESISVFDKWTRLKIITEQEFEKVTSRFLSDINELIEAESLIFANLDTLSVIFSLDFITKHHITINDAIHLHAAKTYSPNIKEFICSDKNLNAAAENEDLVVFNPEN